MNEDIRVNSPTDKPRSLAVSAFWTALGLAFACAGVFLIGQVTNQISPFEHSPRGLLTGFVPRDSLNGCREPSGTKTAKPDNDEEQSSECPETRS